jgi:hypothetical protein
MTSLETITSIDLGRSVYDSPTRESSVLHLRRLGSLSNRIRLWRPWRHPSDDLNWHVA